MRTPLSKYGSPGNPVSSCFTLQLPDLLVRPVSRRRNVQKLFPLPYTQTHGMPYILCIRPTFRCFDACHSPSVHLWTTSKPFIFSTIDDSPVPGVWLPPPSDCRSFGEMAGWAIFFFGVTATAFGSAYYHLRPNDSRLVWDRLPVSTPPFTPQTKRVSLAFVEAFLVLNLNVRFLMLSFLLSDVWSSCIAFLMSETFHFKGPHPKHMHLPWTMTGSARAAKLAQKAGSKTGLD